MKTLVRTIVVLVVLNSAAGCFALAQNVSEREGMEATKEQMKAAEREMEKAYQNQKLEEIEEEFTKSAMEYDMDARRAASRRDSRSRGRSTGRRSVPFAGRYSDSGSIFVIPSSEMKAEDIVTIVEDMRIMSRIFEKKLGSSPGGMFFDDDCGFSFFDLLSARSTEAIFLQDYGALFLMKVDFPLSPPAETEVEEEAQEDIDEIWKETRQEIYEPEDARRRRRRTDEGEEYDKEKVEEMKEALIKALKHTTNIRNLKADESIILTVAGSCDCSGTNQVLMQDKETETERMYGGYGGGGYAGGGYGAVAYGMGGYGGGYGGMAYGGGIYAEPSLTGMDFTPTVMTIRVKKSDVDAFSKGELDFYKFRKKVQIFTY